MNDSVKFEVLIGFLCDVGAVVHALQLLPANELNRDQTGDLFRSQSLLVEWKLLTEIHNVLSSLLDCAILFYIVSEFH